MSIRGVLVAGFAASVFIAGCGDGGAEEHRPIVQDSLGVRIVRHPAEDAELLGTFEMSRVFGTGDGALPLFRVVAGAIEYDGSVLVADAGNYRIVRWGPSGERLPGFGSEGSGPGELLALSWMHPMGPDVALYDSRSRRVSWFRADGALAGSQQFSVERPDPPTSDAIVASGAALGVTAGRQMVGYPMAYAEPDGEAGPLPLLGDIAVYDSASVAVRAVGTFMLLEWYEDPSLDGFPLANRMETPRLHWAGRDELIAIADPVGYRVDILRDGARSAAILEDRPRIPFRPDSIPDQFDLAADSLQAYRDVRIDSVHRIWVQPAVRDDQPTRRWRIFSGAGDRLGDVVLPSDATVLDATRDALLLLRRSALGEESVEFWELQEPAL